MEALKIIGAVIGFFVIVGALINAMDTTEGGISWLIFATLIGFYAVTLGGWNPFKKEQQHLKKLYFIFLILTIAACSVSTDLANNEQINWCVGKTNEIIYAFENRKPTEGITSSAGYYDSAWEILIESNTISGTAYYKRYAGNNLDLWIEYRSEFINKYSDELPSNLETKLDWDLVSAQMLYKFFLYVIKN